MRVKFHFFGKNCLINRSLSDRSDLKRALDENHISFEAIQFVNQVHSADVIGSKVIKKKADLNSRLSFW